MINEVIRSMLGIRKYWRSIISFLQSTLRLPVGVEGSARIRNEAELLAWLLRNPELKKILIEFGCSPQVLLTAVLQVHPADKGSIKSVLKAMRRAKLLQRSSADSKPSVLNLFFAEITGGSTAIREAIERTGFSIGAFVFYLAHGVHEESVATTPFDEPPTEYGIEVVNDNFTPMEFVVSALERHFKLNRTAAINAMLQIHSKGVLVLPQEFEAQAKEIAATANGEARQHGFPLWYRVIAQPVAADANLTPPQNTSSEAPPLSSESADERDKSAGPLESWVSAEYDRTPLWVEHFRAYQAHLGRNLFAGIKASIFRGVSLDQLTVSWMQLMGLLALSVLLPLATQILQVGIDGEFSPAGLTGIFFLFPVILITAITGAKLAQQEEKTLALIIVLSSAGLSIEFFMVFFSYLLSSMSLHRLHNDFTQYADDILDGWLALSAVFIFCRSLQLPRRQRLVAAAVVGLLLLAPLHYVWMDRTVWSQPYDNETAKQNLANYWAAVKEDMLYLQPRLLDQQLNNILPGKPGTSTLYFVGMAGDSEQDVFMREINSIDKLFQDRFGTASHDIKLINNRSTLASVPLATTVSLKSAIQRIGSVMDKDNDVLFLYLTSHGSREHEFFIEFPPLELKNLSPPTLRQMLDEAGIKWRVIVIAACYAGGFIEPLKSENTLVITAAAADRTSFGCSNENDYTYFGRAYFVDGLKDTNSFIKAFDVAKEVVTKREHKDGFEPSNPQIAVGKNIEMELDRLTTHHQAAQL